MILFPETWVWGTAGMLICISHCCKNNFGLQKFTAILDAYGLSLPFYPSDPIHSTHLMLCFTWDSAAIPRNWTSTSWKGQFRCQDFGIKILYLCPVIPQWQCYLYALLALVFDHLQNSVKIYASYLLLEVLIHHVYFLIQNSMVIL